LAQQNKRLRWKRQISYPKSFQSVSDLVIESHLEQLD